MFKKVSILLVLVLIISTLQLPVEELRKHLLETHR